jgi:intermediate peptidase
MDQAFFGPQSPSVVDTTAVLAKLQEEHTSIGHVEGTCWQAKFNHLVGYGAGEPEQTVTLIRYL